MSKFKIRSAMTRRSFSVSILGEEECGKRYQLLDDFLKEANSLFITKKLLPDSKEIVHLMRAYMSHEITVNTLHFFSGYFSPKENFNLERAALQAVLMSLHRLKWITHLFSTHQIHVLLDEYKVFLNDQISLAQAKTD